MSVRALGQQFKDHMVHKAETYYTKKVTPLVNYIGQNVERDMPEINAQMDRWAAARK